MNKFKSSGRTVARERRAKRAERRRLQSRNSSLKVSTVKSESSLSAKKQRKLRKKWRKAQLKALESGLVSMQDIEMMTVDGEAGVGSDLPKSKPKKNKRVFAVKKRARMRLKQAGAVKGTQSSADTMEVH